MIEYFEELQQGSDEWLKARCGVVTASCFKDVLASGRNGAESKTRKSYLYDVACERVTGNPTESYTNSFMERGHQLEEVARQLYTERTGNDVKQFGFIRKNNLGYSPDGVVGENGLIEIKTRLARLQAELLIDGDVPSTHTAQCQGALYITGREWLDFVSYCPGMPLFIKRVFPDLEYFEKLKSELEKFESEVGELVLKIMEKF